MLESMRNQVQVEVIVREAILPSPSAPAGIGRLAFGGIRIQADGHGTLPGVMVVRSLRTGRRYQPAVKFEIEVRVLNERLMIACCFRYGPVTARLHNLNSHTHGARRSALAVGFGSPRNPKPTGRVFFYESVQNIVVRHGSHMGRRIQIH